MMHALEAELLATTTARRPASPGSLILGLTMQPVATTSGLTGTDSATPTGQVDRAII